LFLQLMTVKCTCRMHNCLNLQNCDPSDVQRLIIDTGFMVMIEPSVRYEVKAQGGVAKSLLGGEGLFLVHMTGPGHVTLQTLPFSRTARRVLAAAGGGRDETGSGGILGGILGE